jgi:hypothetical protein
MALNHYFKVNVFVVKILNSLLYWLTQYNRVSQITLKHAKNNQIITWKLAICVTRQNFAK